MHQLGSSFDEYVKIISEKLSKDRYIHCINVSESAKKLAIRHGEDENRACVAGLLHDITKELNQEEQLRLIETYGKKLSQAELYTPKLWHQKTAAIYVEYILGIIDPAIISAIACHTSAKPNMTKLDKIVYLADLISEDRHYPDVERVRTMAFQDLDKTMLTCLKFSIKKLLQGSNIVNLKTIMAYNQYINICKDKKEFSL